MPNFKSEFVRQVLADEGRRYSRNQGLAMQRLLNFKTKRIMTDRTQRATSDNNMGGVLEIKHTAYERFLDIKRKVRNKKTNRVRNRSFRIHNRFVMGHYYGIANRLMFELTNEVRDAIIKDLNALNNNG